ncbi:MAG: S41 family peptidase [Alistipes sp.]|nr:S41 family peptidase [Alistipes sp.]
MSRRVFYTFVGLVAVAGLTIFGVKNDFGLGRNMEMMVNLMRVVGTEYVDTLSADKIMRYGADGIMRNLDPYCTFLSEEEMKDFRTLTTGKYGGIGSVIRQDSSAVRIAEPYRGSPADMAGLKIGDKIVAIDGKSVAGMKTDQVSSMLRGEPNTTVKVAVERLVDGKVVTHKIRRQRISIPSVGYADYVAPGVGYILHSDFTDDCYTEMRAAIERLQAKGELKGLILDYRTNGGGVLQSAVKVLSLFVPKGTQVVEMKGRVAAENKRFVTEFEPMLPDLPLVVLIGENSASAAEIVSGALQDLDRAVLLGSRSYGKGLVQSTLPLGYESYAKITTAKYYIPSGRCIQAVRYSTDGKAESVPDSLITEFATAAGRKVYDGGGIMPDKKIAPEYVSSFAVTLYLMGLMDDFGDEYYRNHPNITIDPQTFSITDEDYARFERIVEAKEIPYKSESRRAVEKLRKALEKERYAASEISEAMAVIEKGLKDDKMSNLQTYKSEIIRTINSDIVLRYCYAEGRTANSLKHDKGIAAAVEMLSDSKEMSRILREQNTARK